MLFRFLTTISLLVFVIALNTNSHFTTDIYKDSGEVLAEEVVNDISYISKVVDGDTIKLKSGEVVRYVGIDTPETKHPKFGLECFGQKAREFNSDLISGKPVRLEKDITDKDRYGRLLRYVYVDLDGTEIMVNKYLVENGYARVSTYPPDVKYQKEFVKLEEEARLQGRGLWRECL